MTPLLCAASNGHLEVVQLLIREKVFDFAANKDGNNALHLAYLNGHKDIADWLIKNGMDTSAKNKDGKTPEQLASSMEQSATGRTSYTFSTPRTENVEKDDIASKLEKTEARRRMLAIAKEESEKKFKSTVSSAARVGEKPTTKLNAAPEMSKYSSDTKSLSDSREAPNEEEKLCIVKFRVKLDPTKSVYEAMVPPICPWETLLESIAKGKSTYLTPSTIQHLILSDEDDELSPPITNDKKFWKYYFTFKEHKGIIFTVHSQPLASSPPSTSHSANLKQATSPLLPAVKPAAKLTPSNGQVLLEFRLASNYARWVSLHIIIYGDWHGIVSALVAGFSLPAEQTVSHVVLVDRDGDEVSPQLNNAEKFWKHFTNYRGDIGMYFAVHLSMSLPTKHTVPEYNGTSRPSVTSAASPPTKYSSAHNSYNNSIVSGDEALDSPLRVMSSGGSRDAYPNTPVTAVHTLPEPPRRDSSTHVSAVTSHSPHPPLAPPAPALSHQGKTSSGLKSETSPKTGPPMTSKGGINLNDNITMNNQPQSTAGASTAPASLAASNGLETIAVRLESIPFPTHSVTITSECSWDYIRSAIATEIGDNMSGHWISHLTMMDADGEPLCPILNNTAKFWKYFSKYKFDEGIVFVATIDEEVREEELRLRRVEEMRKSSKKIKLKLSGPTF
eukprot:gene4350-5514_t